MLRLRLVGGMESATGAERAILLRFSGLPNRTFEPATRPTTHRPHNYRMALQSGDAGPLLKDMNPKLCANSFYGSWAINPRGLVLPRFSEVFPRCTLEGKTSRATQFLAYPFVRSQPRRQIEAPVR